MHTKSEAAPLNWPKSAEASATVPNFDSLVDTACDDCFLFYCDGGNEVSVDVKQFLRTTTHA
jgi:hypothetical protein